MMSLEPHSYTMSPSTNAWAHVAHWLSMRMSWRRHPSVSPARMRPISATTLLHPSMVSLRVSVVPLVLCRQ